MESELVTVWVSEYVSTAASSTSSSTARTVMIWNWSQVAVVNVKDAEEGVNASCDESWPVSVTVTLAVGWLYSEIWYLRRAPSTRPIDCAEMARPALSLSTTHRDRSLSATLPYCASDELIACVSVYSTLPGEATTTLFSLAVTVTCCATFHVLSAAKVSVEGLTEMSELLAVMVTVTVSVGRDPRATRYLSSEPSLNCMGVTARRSSSCATSSSVTVVTTSTSAEAL